MGICAAFYYVKLARIMNLLLTLNLFWEMLNCENLEIICICIIYYLLILEISTSTVQSLLYMFPILSDETNT